MGYAHIQSDKLTLWLAESHQRRHKSPGNRAPARDPVIQADSQTNEESPLKIASCLTKLAHKNILYYK